MGRGMMSSGSEAEEAVKSPSLAPPPPNDELDDTEDAREERLKE